MGDAGGVGIAINLAALLRPLFAMDSEVGMTELRVAWQARL